MIGRSHAPSPSGGSSRSRCWPTVKATAAPLSEKVNVWPVTSLAVGATVGAVGSGEAVPGEALGRGVGLDRIGVTAGIGEPVAARVGVVGDAHAPAASSRVG